MRTLLFLIGISALLVTTGGCGSDARATVKGTVTVGGKNPLTGGSIVFISVADEKRTGSGVVEPDGTYTVVDAPVGECKVIFDNSHLDPVNKKGMGAPPTGAAGMGMGGMKGAPKSGGPPGSQGPSAKDKERMGGAPKGAGVSAEMSADQVDYFKMKWVKIDPKHTRPDSTPHKTTVNAGDNTANFDLN